MRVTNYEVGWAHTQAGAEADSVAVAVAVPGAHVHIYICHPAATAPQNVWETDARTHTHIHRNTLNNFRDEDKFIIRQAGQLDEPCLVFGLGCWRFVGGASSAV